MKEPTLKNENGIITVNIVSVADAIDLMNRIGQSIQMALADGQTGRANGIPVKGDAHALRFQVNIGQTESNTIGFTTSKKPILLKS
jgi:hypothetical protein